jgi:hypothetical protein
MRFAEIPILPSPSQRLFIIDIDPDQVLLRYLSASGSLLFRGVPNEAGFLGKIATDPFLAQNRKAAEAHALTAIQGLLSNLASQLDIPLIIEMVEVTEIATKAKGISFGHRSRQRRWPYGVPGHFTIRNSNMLWRSTVKP